MLLVVSTARANWFSDKIAKNIDLKNEIKGASVAAIAQPTIDSAETSGRRLLQQADQIAGARLGQVDVLLTRQVGGVDILLEHHIGQVDRIAATRLKEVDTILDKDITRIDAIAAKRIQQIDDLLGTRLNDVDTLIKSNLNDVDERIGSRIDQVDQITEQRLGNVQTFAAKAASVVFSGVLWLIGFACLLVFAAAALWRVYKESAGAWPSDGTLWSRIARWWSTVHHRLVWQIVSAAACIAILFLIFFKVLPRGSTENLVTMHRTAMLKSLDALDLPEARYHASQLKILDPGNSVYRGMALKIDLLRDILSRPALYQTPAGIHRTLSRIEQAEAQFGEPRDADIDTLKALILFRTNPTRSGEHDAAMLCAAALKRPVSDSGFTLQPLARNYVENYLSHPLPAAAANAQPDAQPDAPEELAPAALAEVVEKAKADAKDRRALTPMSHVLMYDGLVRDLTVKSVPAYRRMIEAQAAIETAPPAQRAALIAGRAAAAREVIKAWEDFDDALAAHHSLDDTSAAYAVFTLKDAMVSRARAYEKSTAAPLPPVLNEKNYPSPAARARMLPPRVMWAKRYLPNAGSVITYEEAARFRDDEAAAYEFERAFADYLKSKTRETTLRASLAAARLGLAYGETDLATAIAADPAAPLTPEERQRVDRAVRESPVSYL